MYCLKNLKYIKKFSTLFEVLFEKRVPCSVFSGLGQVVWISKLKVKIMLYWRVCVYYCILKNAIVYTADASSVPAYAPRRLSAHMRLGVYRISASVLIIAYVLTKRLCDRVVKWIWVKSLPRIYKKKIKRFPIFSQKCPVFQKEAWNRLSMFEIISNKKWSKVIRLSTPQAIDQR